MTERRAFKARARTLMVETGQTYAQAAAILEADNPARPAPRHPASALVVALLRTAGIELVPEAAFGIGGGIGFMYAVFSYAGVDHPLLTIVCQHHPDPWAPAILDRLDVPYVSVSTKSAVAALLSEERPLILPMADEGRARPDPSEDPREEHVVLALADQGGFRVFDGSGEGRTMQADEVLSAYMRTRRKHPVITLEATADARLDVPAALNAGLRACVSGMREPVLGNSFDVNFGLSGLGKWARLADARGKDGWPALFGDDGQWRRRLVDGIEREHTASTAGRPLFVRTLRAAGFRTVAHAFEQSAHHWRAISHRSASGTLTYAQLAHEVRTIAEHEANGIRTLKDALGPSPV